MKRKSRFLLLFVVIIAFAIGLKIRKSNNNYVNKEYGFTFKIPNNWNDKFEVIEKDGMTTFIYSQYQDEYGNRQEFFTIAVIPKEEYEKELNEPPMTGELLAKKGELVYILNMPLDCIILNENKLQEYTQINLSVDEIKDSFMLND